MERWVLARRPVGKPTEADFRLEQDVLPAVGDGQALIRTVYLSLDPHTRAEIGGLADGVSDAVQDQTLPLLPLGAPVNGYAIGEVLESRSPQLAPGDLVRGYWGWQTHVVGAFGGSDDGKPAASEGQVQQHDNVVFKVDPAVRPVSWVLHVLGEMGLTGYVGMTAVGRPGPGDVVFVSSAAGTVGGVAGQTAKNLGCRVVGSVGSAAKARYIVEELGFDAAVIHSADDVEAQLDAACPEGIDVYFDNVGGAFSDRIVSRLRTRSRVVLCGATADWNLAGENLGTRLYWPLLVRRSIVEGFVLWDYADRYEAGYRQLLDWAAEGRLRNAENILEGFSQVPRAFADFLDGRYHGKSLVRVAPDPTRASDAGSTGKGA